jgi:hypothetical protein
MKTLVPVRRQPPSARDRAEPALLLRRRAVAEDRTRHERVGDGDHRRHHPVDARDLLADQPVGHHVHERAAVFLGNHRREIAERDELADQFGRVAGLALVGLDVGQDLLLGEVADGAAHQALLGREVEVHHGIEGVCTGPAGDPAQG